MKSWKMERPKQWTQRLVACALLLSFFDASSVPSAADVPADEHHPVIQAFIAKQQSTESYQAQLHQTLQLRGLREPVVSKGNIFFRRPDALAIIFTDPPGEFMIIDGDDSWVKKKNKPMRHQPVDRGGKRSGHDALFLLDLFAHGATNTLEHFEATLVRGKDEAVVTLRPKSRQPRSPEPLKIENTINLSDYELREMRVLFENDNSITYRFIDPIRNLPIDRDVFTPQPEIR